MAQKRELDAPEPSALTGAEASALAELRAKLDADPASFPSTELRQWTSDRCCCRYLRARNWNVGKAHTMLTATIQWRWEFFGPPAEEGSDDAALEAKEDAAGAGEGEAAGQESTQEASASDSGAAREDSAAYDPYAAVRRLDVESLRPMMGDGRMNVRPARDMHGHPIVTNIKAKAKPTDHRLGVKMIVYNLERAALAAEEVGQEKWVWIIDLADYTRANSPPLAITRETLSIMSNHYPERLYRCFMVDAPWIFSLLWKPLSALVDSVTKNKIKFLTNGAEHGCKADMLEVIPNESLLVRFGGALAADYDFDAAEGRFFKSPPTKAGAGEEATAAEASPEAEASQ